MNIIKYFPQLNYFKPDTILEYCKKYNFIHDCTQLLLVLFFSHAVTVCLLSIRDSRHSIQDPERRAVWVGTYPLENRSALAVASCRPAAEHQDCTLLDLVGEETERGKIMLLR